MLRAKNLKTLDLSPEDPWSEILASVGYAIRATYHTTLGATPAQIIYGRDMINPIEYIAEWDVIRKNKEKSIQKSNDRENKNRIEHDYKIGDKVMLLHKDLQRKLEDPASGPYSIVSVHTNGTVCILRNSTIERRNIRQIQPYWEKS